MSIDITELSESELKHKIENIKAEREKTANALKRYEEELERRKQEVPLGVPCEHRKDGYTLKNLVCTEEGRNTYAQLIYFSSEQSSTRFVEIIAELAKALVANSKGEPIDIKVLLPLLPKGWVAMNRYKNEWVWHEKKPTCYSGAGLEYWESDGWKVGFLPFNLKPAEDWRNSLMECGL